MVILNWTNNYQRVWKNMNKEKGINLKLMKDKLQLIEESRKRIILYNLNN
jgi:hypothetical protein